MSDQNNNNNAEDTATAPTVFRPKASEEATVYRPLASENSEASPVQASEQKTVIIAKAPQHELTRIRQSIRIQDNSVGFATAKKEADSALQQQKIVLNNRFVLESTLGAGGMGTVYKAQDLRKVEANDIKTEVAVKVLNDEFKDHPDAFVSLQREASRSHILSHPNIVTVHDFDRDGDVIFMTMELLNGQPLDTLMRGYAGTGMPLEKAIPIIEDYCSGLSFAHKKHFVHSDLKPGNLFVNEDCTQVLDFGIARVSNSAVVKDHFDAGDLGALTPAYASLEMLNGEDPCPSDDVYAAALIAYELFTGKHPYNRLPANEAKAQNLKPERIKELSKRQWHALESALIFERDKRTPTIDIFWRTFSRKKRLPIFLFTSAILLIVTSWFSYNTFIAPSEVSKLADSAFVKAQECLSSQKSDCAIESIKAVLKLNPEYQGAQAILNEATALKLSQSLTALSSDVQQCIYNTKDIACAEKALYSMQSLSSQASETVNAEHELTRFKERLQIASLLEKSKLCLQTQSYQCVVEQTALILNINAEHQAAIELNTQAKNAIKANEAARLATEKQFDEHLARGNWCFKQNKYTCAKNSADSALALNSSEAARTLQRNAEMAIAEQKRNAIELKRNTEKADQMMVQAKKCLTKKQYDCAIAKSESALNLVPKYAPALAILKQATDERQQLKFNFSLQ